nr:YigZ family protein [Pseudomonas sp.]
MSTLVSETEYQEIIRKSRFLARATNIAGAADAMDFIARVSDPAANHNCWAYRLGNEYRFSDDGEPGGTAGRPILQAIEGQACDRVVVVVTRWFGGVKLGTGGLVRAYGGCAAQCLRLADKTELVAYRYARISCTFAELPVFRARLGELGVRIEDESFTAEGVDWQLAAPQDVAPRAGQLLTDISRGRLQVEWQDDAETLPAGRRDQSSASS